MTACLEGTAELAVLTGGQRTGPETGTLSPADTAALETLIEAFDLDWPADGLFRNEHLTWTPGEEGVWRLTGLDLTGLCPWGDLDLTPFSALENVSVRASQLETLRLPPLVTWLPDGSLASNPALEQVVFPGDTLNFGANAFAGCSENLAIWTLGGEAVTATVLPDGEPVRLLLAAYDGDGRMTALAGTDGTGTEETLTGACAPADAAGYRAFRLSPQGMIPLGPALPGPEP